MKHLPYPKNQTREKARTVKSQCHIIGKCAPEVLASGMGMDAYLYCMAERTIMERPEARTGPEEDGRGKHRLAEKPADGRTRQGKGFCHEPDFAHR